MYSESGALIMLTFLLQEEHVMTEAHLTLNLSYSMVVLSPFGGVQFKGPNICFPIAIGLPDN